jgi:nitronate monooxygenase
MVTLHRRHQHRGEWRTVSPHSVAEVYAGRPGAGEVIAHFASGEAIVRYEPAPPMIGTTGQIEALSMWVGQSVALAKQTQPAADIVAELTSRL